MNCNGDDVRIPDDVAVELGDVLNENLPTGVRKSFEKKPSRTWLVWSWWIVLARTAPDGIGVAGLKYALVSRENWCRRIGWIVILLCAIVAASFQIIERAIFFSSHPLSVDISLNQSIKELTFPKVIICNYNSFVKSKTQASPIIDKLLRNYENLHYNPSEVDPLTPDELEFIQSLSTVQLFEDLKHRKEDMFVRVVFGGKPISLDDIVTVITPQGLCYQVNDVKDGRKLLKTSSGGKLFGLSMILNTEQDEYYYNTYLKDAAGFTIQLLDQNEVTYMNQEGFQVGPGKAVAVDMTVNKNYNEKPPHGVCGSKKLKYFEEYSRTKCKIECMTDAVISTCGCRLPSLAGNATVCDPIIMTTCGNAFFEPGIQNTTYQPKDCECPIDCEETSFSYSVSSAMYPSLFRERLLEEYLAEGLLDYDAVRSANMTYIEYNFVAVDIFFHDISTMVVTQHADYTAFALLSDIGGSLGLYLGGSLLTIYEILDLCGHSFFHRKR
ncbi:acid-sensing ion channel 1B-like [Lytechinus variegatus]|uniref:acid-sensing ion channel 1B-like n=1 Tax=Lytechinus variegatus TaxID=7654 RepID=UPI001BB27315|nr:acid-sensing ion channel 1B-like [Lytechinus variegatus]